MPEDPPIVVRGLEPRDMQAMTEIHNQRHVAEMTLQIVHATEADRAKWLEPRPDLRFLVAEIDGRVVGGAGLSLYNRRRAHVGSFGMAVDEGFRGRGVGSALLDAIIDLADNWYNLRRLELQVYTDNAPAIGLYERAGFVIEGTHRGYAWRAGQYVDAYAMARLRDEPPITASSGRGLVS